MTHSVGVDITPRQTALNRSRKTVVLIPYTLEGGVIGTIIFQKDRSGSESFNLKGLDPECLLAGCVPTECWEDCPIRFLEALDWE